MNLLHISFRTNVVNILKQFLLIFTEANKVHSLSFCLFPPQFSFSFVFGQVEQTVPKLEMSLNWHLRSEPLPGV